MRINEFDIKSYKDTLKEMISIAYTLAESKNRVIYELGHHLADNTLSKVCMLIAMIDNKDALVFINGKDGETHNFPSLYRNIIEQFYLDLPKYEDLVKKFHRDRNIYQHRFETLAKTFVQQEAKKYVTFVISVMKKAKIIEANEVIPSADIKNDFTEIRKSITLSIENEFYIFYNSCYNKFINDKNTFNELLITLNNIINQFDDTVFSQTSKIKINVLIVEIMKILSFLKTYMADIDYYSYVVSKITEFISWYNQISNRHRYRMKDIEFLQLMLTNINVKSNEYLVFDNNKLLKLFKKAAGRLHKKN